MLNQILVDSVMAGSAYALFALSSLIIYIPTRFFHFAHGAVFAWGAYLGYYIHVVLRWPMFLAVSAAIIAPSLIGVLLEICIYRPLRRRGASSSILLLASLGLYIVLQNGLSSLFGDDAKSMTASDIQTGFSLVGARVTFSQLCSLGVSISTFGLVAALFHFTKLGWHLRAISSNPQLAQVRGVNADSVIALSFAIGSGMAGLAAFLIALDVNIDPAMGLGALVTGTVALIAGGTAKIAGPFVGGLLLAFAQNFGVWKIGSQWQDTIALGLLILFLTLKPQGFFSRIAGRIG